QVLISKRTHIFLEQISDKTIFISNVGGIGL
ncbi:unnamed protein product, partial [marine sediment metagenome]